MHTDVDVVVVGAGLSGLATGFALARQGIAVELLDSAARVGGVIQSVRRDEALYETGPNSALDTLPLINEWLDLLGIRAARTEVRAIAATRYVVRDGKLTALPTSPGALLTSQAFSLGAKFRLWREPFVPPAASDVEESIAAFVRRRLGNEILDYAVDPFVSGVYAGDAERISMSAAFPQIHSLEQKYGSVIKGAFGEARERRRNPEHGKHPRRSFSFRGGMQTLTDALASHAGRVFTHSPVHRIERTDDGGWSVGGARAGETFVRTAKSVVVAAPAAEAARLIRALSPAAATALDTIEYAAVASVATLYRREDVGHSLAGFGFLAPKREQRSILGTLFSSSMFEGRAPEGSALLTSFVGGVRHPERVEESDDEIAALVGQELGALIGARGEPQWTAITRWTRAIPQYNVGHRERMRVLDEAERALPGVFFCANYRDGVSVGDRIKAAQQAASTVAQYVGSR